MSDRVRMVLLVGLIGVGTTLAVAASITRSDPPLRSTLAPAFQLLGEPVQSMNHLVTRVIPVGELQEAELGQVYRARYGTWTDTTSPRFGYINALLDEITAAAEKPFPHRAFLVEYDVPNAVALPGGVILVTTGLFDVLGSEAELVSVLGHEVGHVERGHCLDAVRFGLLADRVGVGTLGDLADFAVRLLVSHSFSKPQENDADEYAWAVIEPSVYDPRGVGKAFESLMRYQMRHGQTEPGGSLPDPVRDYFLSHPPLSVREATFRERAQAWWRRHPDAIRSLGVQNLSDMVPVPLDDRID